MDKHIGNNRKTLIYIASDNRSGSTLLDYLLSNHDQMVSVGELLNLDDHLNHIGFGKFWNWSCSCGKPLEACPFWSKVIEEYERRQGTSIYGVKTKYFHPRAGFVQLLICLLVFLTPHEKAKIKLLANFYGHEESLSVAAGCLNILKHISVCTGKDTMIESSKYPYRLFALLAAKQSDFDIRVIHLVRDCRAVSFSKLRRAEQSGKKTTYFKAILGWLVINLEALNLRPMISKRNYIRVSYEKLCQTPEAVLPEICTQFNLPYRHEMTRLVKRGKHNIGGSPHRFEESTEIRLDERWKSNMTPWRKVQFYGAAFWLNKVLGH